MSELFDAGDDDRLLAALGSALRQAEAPPAHLVEGARAALAWRTIDAELAEIASDSALTGTAGVRSAATPTRTVAFAVGEVEVELTAVESGSGLSGERPRLELHGQLVPPSEGILVEAQHRDGVTPATTDAFGAFTVEGIPAGPVRVRVALPSGAVVTETVTF